MTTNTLQKRTIVQPMSHQHKDQRHKLWRSQPRGFVLDETVKWTRVSQAVFFQLTQSNAILILGEPQMAIAELRFMASKSN